MGGRIAAKSGRSWWSVRYTDGTIINEWDDDAGSPNQHRDWARIPFRGRQAVRLYCPNGKMVELGDSRDGTGKLIQLKARLRGVSLGGITVLEQRMLFHMIGIISGLDGQCTIYAWEILTAPEMPKMPDRPDPDADYYRTAADGVLTRDFKRWQVECKAIEGSPEMRQWRQDYATWEGNACGRLVGPFSDNVYGMQYQSIGPISADAIGLSDGEGR